MSCCMIMKPLKSSAVSAHGLLEVLDFELLDHDMPPLDWTHLWVAWEWVSTPLSYFPPLRQGDLKILL